MLIETIGDFLSAVGLLCIGCALICLVRPVPELGMTARVQALFVGIPCGIFLFLFGQAVSWG